MVGNEEGQLIRQTQEGFDTSGICGHWEVFYSFYSVNIWLNTGAGNTVTRESFFFLLWCSPAP